MRAGVVCRGCGGAAESVRIEGGALRWSCPRCQTSAIVRPACRDCAGLGGEHEAWCPRYGVAEAHGKRRKAKRKAKAPSRGRAVRRAERSAEPASPVQRELWR